MNIKWRSPKISFLSILVILAVLLGRVSFSDMAELKLDLPKILGASDELSFLFPSPSPTPLMVPTTIASTSAIVTKVIDGDTIELNTGQKLRYIGMDTPETSHPSKGKQCFGQEAKKRNSELVLGKTVSLIKDVSETDRYGRLLRYVYVDGELINQKLVNEGFAFARSYPPDISKQAELREAERKAQQDKLGLWSGCNLSEFGLSP